LDSEVTWLDTSGLGSAANEQSEGQSKSNRSEAETIVRLLRRMSASEEFWNAYDAGDAPQEKPIGVITMYGAQKTLLNKYLVTSGLRSGFLARIKVDTVDSYQGQENAIVFLSIVRNNVFGDLGYVKDLRRVNVALSRAMERLVIVGSTRFIDSVQQDNPMGRVLNYIRSIPELNNRIIASDSESQPLEHTNAAAK
jgi:superfamily I DNA and/or RNA helicase